MTRTTGNYRLVLTPFATFTDALHPTEALPRDADERVSILPAGADAVQCVAAKMAPLGQNLAHDAVIYLARGLSTSSIVMAEADDVICNTLVSFVRVLSLVDSYFFECAIQHTIDNEKEVKNSMSTMETKAERLYGIDSLKIISMLMVVLLHVLNHGGILEALDSFSAQYAAGHLLRCLAICAVDVYVMISGYLYVKKEFKLRNITHLWLTVLFYSAMIPLLLKIAGEKIEIKTVISGFFPILRSQYWFFTQYFAMFFMMPVLNQLISNRRLAGRTILVLILLCSVLPVFSLGNDLFKTEYGYSFLWFVVLYLCGGYCKRILCFR